MNIKKLQPKLITVLKEGYTKQTFFKDLSAGVIVGIVALPLAIAFAIASGVKPEQGLYTAIVAGFVISLLSGSRVQIGGPTGAFIVIVYGIVQKYGYDGLAVATLLAGIILIIMGFAGLGAFIKYIPYPVTIGFTSGIAVIIFTGQIRDFFGLHIEQVPADFVEKIIAYTTHFGTINLYATGLSVFTLLLLIISRKYIKKIPASLGAVILTTLIVAAFKFPVDTIGSRFGEITGSLPKPHLPWAGWGALKELVSPAFSIAFLAGIESLLSAVVADGMTGKRHRSNMELVAQGTANVLSPLFGGIPATGAIARTATNIRNGGSTPIAGMIHAIVLLLILLAFGRWVAYIPMATLAAILILVAWDMSEYKVLLRITHYPKSDAVVLLCTFLLTVFLDLTVAIQIGMVLACILFIHRMISVSDVSSLRDKLVNEEKGGNAPDTPIHNLHLPNDVEVFEINGPFFFGATEKFRTVLNSISMKPKILILSLVNVPLIDATGLNTLETVCREAINNKIMVLLAGAQRQPMKVMKKADLIDWLGEDKVFANLHAAISYAKKSLAP